MSTEIKILYSTIVMLSGKYNQKSIVPDIYVSDEFLTNDFPSQQLISVFFNSYNYEISFTIKQYDEPIFTVTINNAGCVYIKKDLPYDESDIYRFLNICLFNFIRLENLDYFNKMIIDPRINLSNKHRYSKIYEYIYNYVGLGCDFPNYKNYIYHSFNLKKNILKLNYICIDSIKDKSLIYFSINLDNYGNYIVDYKYNKFDIFDYKYISEDNIQALLNSIMLSIV